MLTKEQKDEITEVVHENLDKVERVWDEVGSQLVYMCESIAMDEREFETVNSIIPGHSFVNEGRPTVDTYIALVADMRDSSKHLLHKISERTTDVNQLQRVYFETSALLPALAQTIKYENGVVTEYLGDGVLSLFLIEDSEDEESRAKVIYAAHRAAKNCLEDSRNIVNEALFDRYNLPPLNMGIGLSMSEALVTLVGLKKEKQAKVIGECVYRATKLSSGTNEIIVDDSIKNAWPQKKGGTLRFVHTSKRTVDGYIITKI